MRVYRIALCFLLVGACSGCHRKVARTSPAATPQLIAGSVSIFGMQHLDAPDLTFTQSNRIVFQLRYKDVSESSLKLEFAFHPNVNTCDSTGPATRKRFEAHVVEPAGPIILQGSGVTKVEILWPGDHAPVARAAMKSGGAVTVTTTLRSNTSRALLRQDHGREYCMQIAPASTQ